MIATRSSSSRPSLNRMLSKSLIVGVVSTVGLLSGFVPELSGKSPTLNFHASVYAQSDGDVQNFARAAYTIEKRRLAVSEEVKKITGSVPDIACNQPDRLESFPGNVRGIIVDFCNFSRQTIEKSGLTVQQFNDIMTRRQSDPQLQERINAAIRGLQQ